jgi:hypothetical protein
MHSLTKPYHVWKTVTVGRGFSEKQIVEELISANCAIDQHAAEFIRRSKFKVSQERKEVDFVLVAVMQLGLIRGSFQEIMERASTLGLHACSVEAALMLRLVSCRTPMGDEDAELISVAMNPIETTYQRLYRQPSILCLANGATSISGKAELCVRHLSCRTTEGRVLYDGQDDDLWAFVSPRVE